MLRRIWKCYSAFCSALGYFVHCIFDSFPHIGPSLIGDFLFTRKKPDDVEGHQDSLFGIQPPTIVNNGISRSDIEHNAAIPVESASPVLYEPPLNEILTQGSTCLIARVKPGIIIKCPRYSWWNSEVADQSTFVKDIKRSFEVEERLLEILGMHPRIIRYIGASDNPRGLLFSEASDGNLQAYIDRHNDIIDISLRLKWRSQAAEAVHYIHQKGVIHSDLRPENFLLHTVAEKKLDLVLCDFGGSTNGDIDGGHLPDPGFFNPCNPWVSTEATDIFSLGSVFYTIMTGHWPYKSPGPFNSLEEMNSYDDRVDSLFASKRYPSVRGIAGGSVIQGCWTELYRDVATLIDDQSSQFKMLRFWGNDLAVIDLQ